MFLSYDTIGYIKGPEISLVKDVETGTVAVRKKLRPELLDVYRRLMDETCQGFMKPKNTRASASLIMNIQRAKRLRT